MKYSRTVRDAAAESIAEPTPRMMHDKATKVRIDCAAHEAGLTEDRAMELIYRWKIPIRRSGRLVFASVDDLRAARR